MMMMIEDDGDLYRACLMHADKNYMWSIKDYKKGELPEILAWLETGPTDVSFRFSFRGDIPDAFKDLYRDYTREWIVDGINDAQAQIIDLHERIEELREQAARGREALKRMDGQSEEELPRSYSEVF